MWIRTSFVTLLAVLWGMVLLLGVPAELGAGLSVVALSGALFWRARDRRNLRRDAQALVAALAPETNVPAQHPQHRFTAVLQDLQNHTEMTAPLAELPLYVAIGAAHSGLGTFLQHAGVTWLAHDLPNIGGCTWSVARECAVLRPRDAVSARAGLDALYHHRHQAPVNGFIVTLSLEDLLDKPDAALRTQAQQLRNEVDVLQEVLHCRAPVYLVLTKCDRLAGFLETFSTLPPAARGRLLGRTITAPHANPVPLEWLSGQLDTLVQSLAMETLAVMQGTADVAARERIYQFPDQLSVLRSPLLAWANAFFASSRRRAMPALQGVFLVAVAQGGYAYDRLLGSTPVRVPMPVTPPTPYFTARVFREALLLDRDHPTALGVKSSPHLARQVGWAAAALLLALPLLAYLQNAYYVTSSSQVVAETVRDLEGSDSHLASLPTLTHLRAQLDLLDAGAQRTAWLNDQSGMSQSPILSTAVRALYLRTLRDAVLQPMVGYDAQQMAQFAQRHADSSEPPPEAEFKLFFDKLRVHLLLTGAYDRAEHRMDAADMTWLADVLSHRWLRTQDEIGSADAEVQEALKQHLLIYLAALDPSLRLARDVEAIVGTRRVLARVDPATALLIQGTSAAALYSLDLTQLLGNANAPLYTEAVIPGAFTRAGWENSVRPRLEELSQRHDSWVLGPRAVARMAPTLAGDGAAAVEAIYWQRYADVWRSFLTSVHTVPLHDAEETALILQQLESDSGNALAHLKHAVAYNLDPLLPGMAGDGGVHQTARLFMAPDTAAAAAQIASLQPLRDSLREASQQPSGHDAQSMNSAAPQAVP